MEDSRKTKIKNSFLRIHAARRSTLYFVRVLLLVIFTIFLCALAFFTAERISNLYILATEGMNVRANCILEKDIDQTALEEYFLPSCIKRDVWLHSGTYNNYSLSSKNYNLHIDHISVTPWAFTAVVTATEQVGLKGMIETELVETGKGASDYPVPDWQGGRYDIHFVNNGERWYISELELVDSNPKEEPLNTPDMEMDVLPMATPTPTVELYDLK